MNCQCCGASKARVTVKESVLVHNNKLLLCTECRRLEHEPRYFVIVAAKSNKDVSEFVHKSRYCGEPLAATDVVT
jgi:hypothetical protein